MQQMQPRVVHGASLAELIPFGSDRHTPAPYYRSTVLPWRHQSLVQLIHQRPGIQSHHVAPDLHG